MMKHLSGHLWISEYCTLARSSSVSFWGEIEDPCEYPYFEGAVNSLPQWGKGNLGVAEGTTEGIGSPLYHVQSLCGVVAACGSVCWESLREDEDVVSSCVDSLSLWSLGFCVALPLLLDESLNIESWKQRWWGCEDGGQDPFVMWVEFRGCVMSLCSRSFLLLDPRASEMLSWFWPFSDALWQKTRTCTDLNDYSDLKHDLFCVIIITDYGVHFKSVLVYLLYRMESVYSAVLVELKSFCCWQSKQFQLAKLTHLPPDT